MKKVLFSLLMLIFIASSLTGCAKSAENYVFGTYYSIEVEGKNATKKVDSIEDLLKEIENKVSTNVLESDVSKNNKAKAVRLSTLEAICKALNCQPGDILEYVPDKEENNDE